MRRSKAEGGGRRCRCGSYSKRRDAARERKRR